MEKVRIDKWLWAVRVFKSRTLASDAVKDNKVKVNGVFVKSSATIQRGDSIEVKKEGFNLTYKVKDLLEKRVSAPLAQACYENLTPESELQKFDVWHLAQTGKVFREKGTGRPTKRERREIDRASDEEEGEDFEEEEE